MSSLNAQEGALFYAWSVVPTVNPWCNLALFAAGRDLALLGKVALNVCKKKRFFKANVRAVLSFISFQGALEELREELQVSRMKKISSLCFLCLRTKFIYFIFHTACNILESTGRHRKQHWTVSILDVRLGFCELIMNCNTCILPLFLLQWLG